MTEPTRTLSASIPSGDDDKLTAAEEFALRLDRPMGVLGLLFLFVVLGQLLATDPVLVAVLSAVGWVFWAVFVVRFGGVLSAGVRGPRSAGRLLSNRIGLLSAVTAIVILVTSQLLYLTETYDSYADALCESALIAISGTPLSADTGFSRLLEVVLSIYSVAVFATLAGALGAFFLRGQSLDGAGDEAEASATRAAPERRERD